MSRTIARQPRRQRPTVAFSLPRPTISKLKQLSKLRRAANHSRAVEQVIEEAYASAFSQA